MQSRVIPGAVAFLLFLAIDAAAQDRKWDEDLGKPAPALIPAGWSGTPVSLEVLRKRDSDSTEESDAGSTVADQAGAIGGNTIVLAFWNADIPC